MKKLTSVLLIFTMLLTLALATPVSASKSGGLAGYVPHLEAGKTITVDGTVDEAYANALIVPIYVPDGRSTAQTGTTGMAYMLWSEGKFYTYVYVYDTDVVTPTPHLQATSPWITDSFEIFFDLGNDQSQPIIHARVDHSGYGSFFIENDVADITGQAAKAYFDFAAQQTGNGYCVELCVDLSKYATIKEGMEIGINLMINDIISENPYDRAAIYYMPSKLQVRDWWKDCYDYVILGSENISAPAMGISLDRETLSLDVAQTAQLTATVYTEKGSHHQVTWASSRPNVATVSSDGTVTAKAKGITAITATSPDGTHAVKCTVTVGEPLRYDAAYGTVTVDGVISGGEWDNVPAAEMANATNPGFYLSSNPTMKIKNDDMYMYVLVEAQTPDADNNIFVCVHVDHGDCDLESCESYIKIVVDGDDVAANNSNQVWTYCMDADRNGKNDFASTTNGGRSDLVQVAYNYSNGKFIAELRVEANYGAMIPAGAASVDVRLDNDTCWATHQWAYQLRTWDPTFSPEYDGGTVYFDVKEVTEPVTGITLDQTSLSLDIDETATLTATVLPANATVKGVKWRSSVPSIAEVSENGTVKAKRAGTTMITATTADGSLVAVCAVTVTNALYIPNGTVISEFAYRNRLELTDVKIPDGVIMIGFRAFQNCVNLTSVTIPQSVVAIGGEAFSGCENLTIYGYEGSFAQSYAADNSIPFVALAEITVSADLNDDGSVDTSDLQYLNQHIGRPAKYPLPDGISADYTGDGKVDTADLLYLNQHIGRPGKYPIP